MQASLPAFTPCVLRAPSLFRSSFVHCARQASHHPRVGRPGTGRVVASAAVDLKFVKENLSLVRQNIANRNVEADPDLVVSLYDEFVNVSRTTDMVRKKRNENAAIMKNAGKMEPQQRAVCIADGKKLKAELAELEAKLLQVEHNLQREAAKIPNMTHPDVPVGDEADAKLVALIGEKRDFAADSFECVPHLELAEKLDMVDFEHAARVSGNKFYYLRNDGALLELALVNWAMTQAAAAGFTLLTTPDVARESVVASCGFQPRGEASQVYRVEDSDLCLVGTAEIPLGGYYADQILDKERLPIKMAAFSHCFRKEVGAAGSTTRGLYRVHQFSKVELFVIAHPDQSDEIHEQLREFEQGLYESLGLHFQVLDMPTGDLGNPAYRKYDIEAWMPGRQAYGEISSASNCTDYQARRLNMRFREKAGDNRFVHTLNATACAVPRMIIAILETHQQKDGSVLIPEPLRPFMGGKERITAAAVEMEKEKEEAVSYVQ